MDIMGGILIMPSSKNGGVIKNILSIVFNEISRKENQLPYIDRIVFLENEDIGTIKVKENDYLPCVAYKNIIDDLKLDDIEIRCKVIKDYKKDIPKVIFNAIKEVGKEKIILDLTSGRKDITGSLYTAASICEINNMIYVEVFKKDNTHKFYELFKDDCNIQSKYRLTKFQTIDEIEHLASLNCIEFIMYRKSIDEILLQCQNRDLELYCTHLNNAIQSYFQFNEDSILQCIRGIGVINEKLIGIIGNGMQEKFKSMKLDENLKPKEKRSIKYIELYNLKYDRLSANKNRNDTENEQLENLQKIFSYVPTLYYSIRLIQSYRNHASHEINGSLNKEDAKIVIDSMIKILNGLNSSNFLKEIFRNE